jgi:hypothetical protein
MTTFLRIPNSTVKITVPDGQMTLPWRRFFQDIVTDVNALSPPIFGSGNPGTIQGSTGQIFYDTSVTPYLTYVYNNGAWHRAA